MKDKIILLYGKYKEIINYIVVGVFTTIISIGSYALFRMIISNYNISNILSWLCAVSFAYYANRLFVFESKNNQVKREFLKFTSSRLFSLLIEIITMFILVSILKVNDMIAKVMVQVIVLVLNYILSKIFVFKN